MDDFDYAVFVNSGTLKCFGCGKEGHLVRACPEIAPKNRPEPSEAPAGPSKDVDAVKQQAASIEITEENVVTAKQCGENPNKATHDDENVEIGKQVLKNPESFFLLCVDNEKKSVCCTGEGGQYYYRTSRECRGWAQLCCSSVAGVAGRLAHGQHVGRGLELCYAGGLLLLLREHH